MILKFNSYFSGFSHDGIIYIEFTDFNFSNWVGVDLIILVFALFYFCG